MKEKKCARNFGKWNIKEWCRCTVFVKVASKQRMMRTSSMLQENNTF